MTRVLLISRKSPEGLSKLRANETSFELCRYYYSEKEHSPFSVQNSSIQNPVKMK
jgi:hypothetical protein